MADGGRLAKMRSWVFMTCSAISAEETTTVGATRPNWRSIRGPYLLERELRDR